MSGRDPRVEPDADGGAGGQLSDTDPRDHGGGLDAARARWGGERADWLDLSTGINPVPYPLGELPGVAWTALPDARATAALLEAARSFWRVPDGAAILAAPGASALIARLPGALAAPQTRITRTPNVQIEAPTYNEHAAAFRAAGWRVADEPAPVAVRVHPNNPDGRLWTEAELAGLTVVDESFCDTCPERSLIAHAGPHALILKSIGKFWGLAGLRLGFAIGDPARIGALAEALGPWPVSGPALAIGARALFDRAWAEATRDRLAADARRLDTLLARHGARAIGGTDLFRLYEVESAAAWQARLARGRVWSRIFPYSTTWIRLGLPAPGEWDQLAAALERVRRE